MKIQSLNVLPVDLLFCLVLFGWGCLDLRTSIAEFINLIIELGLFLGSVFRTDFVGREIVLGLRENIFWFLFVLLILLF